MSNNLHVSNKQVKGLHSNAKSEKLDKAEAHFLKKKPAIGFGIDEVHVTLDNLPDLRTTAKVEPESKKKSEAKTDLFLKETKKEEKISGTKYTIETVGVDLFSAEKDSSTELKKPEPKVNIADLKAKEPKTEKPKPALVKVESKQVAPATNVNEADIDLFSDTIDSITKLDTHSSQ